MPRGPRTRRLSTTQIHLLDRFRRASHEGAPHGYSLPLLRTAMGASFGWETLKKALAGRPVLELHYAYIAEWIERFLERPPAPRDGKAAASGEREEQEPPEVAATEAVNDAKETTGTTGTVRGSR
jgi:hypothetical protein